MTENNAMTNLVLYSHASDSFYCTQAQAEALDTLRDTNKGGIGAIHGYVPSASKYIKVPVYDAQFLTRFSTPKLYQRRAKALEAITFNDVAPKVAADPVLSLLSMADCKKHFDDRKAALIETLTKTLSGDRDDAHRQGHDRCYATISEGVKVNYITEKSPSDGKKYPVLVNGIPQVESIMLMVLELNRHYIVEGQYKPVKSGAPVLMGKVIESFLNKRSVAIKAISLKSDNFAKLTLSGTALTPATISEQKRQDAKGTPEQLAFLLECLA